MNEMTAIQRDKVMADLRAVVTDTEQLLKLTADQVSESTAGLRERLQERLSQSKANLLDLQASVTEKAKAVGHAADDYVHENPWQSVGVGVAVGLVVGLLIDRR